MTLKSRSGLRGVVLVVWLCCLGMRTAAQAVDAPDPNFPSEKNFVRHILADQKAVLTSPAHFRPRDFKWLIPEAGVLTGLLITDRTSSFQISQQASLRGSKRVDDALSGSIAATTLATYLYGKAAGNDHAREAGLLTAEALADSLIVTEGLKLATGRQRPDQGGEAGRFFSGGQSFPSENAAAAWSFAAVMAHEYPGWLSKVLAYGAASGISVARVTQRRHFLSDVVIGAALGYSVGHYVYREHHDDSLGGTSVHESHNNWLDSKRSGFTYVPLDSWIYPDLERLMAFGYVNSAYLDMRPWTREQCAEMVDEAGDIIHDADTTPPEVAEIYGSLRSEFGDELGLSNSSHENLVLESVYSRLTEIAGKPLNDSYHFGQTLINDFGRPYQQGFNSVDGFTARAETGPFFFYARGEYQHAPGAAPYPLNVRDTIAAVDRNPVQPGTNIPKTNQFRLLDTYAGVNLFDNELSVGKQSLWWGPGESGPLLMSDNAEPIYMLRLNRVRPIHLFGAMTLRFDAFFGKLSGNQFPRQAFIHGEKISVKPTANLELGFTRIAELGGTGRALTFAAAANSYFSLKESSFFGADNNPGKRTGGFDMSYRIPFARDWLSVYADSLSSDDPSPLASPRRAAIAPGMYAARIPGLQRLDLRVEATNTNTPSSSIGGTFIYHDFFYHDLHTNKGNLLGSWVGREGTGIQAESRYAFSAQSSIGVGYRESTIAKDFWPGGGDQDDYFVQGKFRVSPTLELSTFLQYERWKVPVLDPNWTTNFTTSVQLTYWPKRLRMPHLSPQ